jgi:hypothetical protein
MIIHRWILLRIRNISDKFCRENHNTFYVQQRFLPERCAVYEIMWKNVVQPDRPQMTMWLMRVACRTINATHTHTRARTHAHTHGICNTYFSSTVTDNRRRLTITFKRTVPVLLSNSPFIVSETSTSLLSCSVSLSSFLLYQFFKHCNLSS